MKHYLIIGGKLEDSQHHKSLITIMQGSNINEIVVIITGLFSLICNHYETNYTMEGNDRLMRIVNRISDNNISYIEIKEVTI